jgi:glycosyltransferase involved in cell wall biosynthesis
MDRGRVRVVHVISGLGVGGAERLVLLAARYHDRKRYPLSVVSLMSGGELAPEVRETGVPVLELGQERGRLTPAGFRSLLSAVKGFGPELVQGHMFHSNILTRLCRFLSPGSGLVLNTIHIGREAAWRRLLYGATAPLVNGTVTFSPEAARVFTTRDAMGRPVRHIPYGIEVENGPTEESATMTSLLGRDLPGPVWIAVGRLSREKGFPDLIEAFSKLGTGSGGPTLLIVGEGEERGSLERMIRERGIGEKVRLLGQRMDVPLLLLASDYFVLSSRGEGNPLVLLEAMRAGLPVVATRVGMVPTMAVDGETAILIEPRRPDLLTEAMDRLMKSGSKARDMGRAGRKRLERYYDFRSMQREMEKFYDELTGRAPSGSGG